MSAVLTEEDLTFFEKNGYVTVPDAVPPANRQAVIDAIFDFLGFDPNDPGDWYREPHRHGGMVEMYQTQALWDNRQHPRIYQAMRDIYTRFGERPASEAHKLWVSMDRANLKPPSHPDHPEYNHPGFTHWDMDVWSGPQPFAVQGVLCLTDTTPEMGGFRCVPGFIGEPLEKWIADSPGERRGKRSIDHSWLPAGFEVTQIPAKAGDFIIWDRRLAHGNGLNTSDKPRLAQYITMRPAREDDEKAREDRVMRWRERLPPAGDPFPGDPRKKEQLEGKTAELTPLGRCLLGADRWGDAPPGP